MPFRHLTQFARAHPALTPAYYGMVHLRYVIDIDEQGRLRSITDTLHQSRLWRRPAPLVGRTAGILPMLLADTVDYTFGPPPFAGNDARALACQQAYQTLVEDCAAATGDPSVQIVSRFLQHHSSPLPVDADTRAVVTFRVNGRLVIDIPAVQRFWADLQHERQDLRSAVCSICRRTAQIPLRTTERVRGLAGGSTAGSVLLTINIASAESYGMAHAHGGNVCPDCARLMNWGLNYLLHLPQHTLCVAGYTAVYWFSDRSSYPLTTLLTGTSQYEALAALEKLRSADPATTVHCLGLMTNGGRVRLLDSFQTSVGALLHPLEEWISLQAGNDERQAGRLIGLHQLSAAYTRPLRAPGYSLVRSLLRFALLGEAVPHYEAEQVLQSAIDAPPTERAQRALFQICWPVRGHSTAAPTTQDYQARALGRLVVIAERVRARARGTTSGTLRLYRSLLREPARTVPTLLAATTAELEVIHREQPAVAARYLERMRRHVTSLGQSWRPLPAVSFLRGYLNELTQPDVTDD